MAKIKIIFLVLFLSISCFVRLVQTQIPDERGYIVKVGDKVDDFKITMVDGSSKMLSEFNSPVIVLNFFASWCIVCRKLIPHIEKEIWQPLKKHDLIVLGVDYKEKPDTIKKFVAEMKITYPVALDEHGEIFTRFARGGVTRNVVLDQTLNIIFLTRLFDPQEFGSMKNLIHRKLGVVTDSIYALQHEGNIMEKNILKDFAASGKKIVLQYQGQHQVHLEGRINAVNKKMLEVGISLFKEDIVSKKYDKKTKILRIGYKHYEGIRIAILPMTLFQVPADIEQIIVFDVK